MTAKLRIIGYARESTRDQAINGFNLDDQEKKIIQYTEIYYEDKDYQLTVFREEGASAKSLERPRMKEIMELVSKQQVDIIIIHNLDRLTRQVKDLAVLLEQFDLNDVSLVSITEKIDTKTPMGRFFIYLIVLIAQWEWETISSRSKRGILESARQGNYATARHPLGYRRNPEDNHKLIVFPQEAEVVITMFEDVAYRDYRIDTLARKMTKEHVLGMSWSEKLVEKVINNKIYYGTFERFGVEFPNNTIPIIDKELYDLAHKRLKVKKTYSRKRYVYKGFVYCKLCGRLMLGHSCQSKNGVIHLYYRCASCKKMVSEKAINKEFMPMFDSILENGYLRNEYGEMVKHYKDISEVLESIPVSLVDYKMEVKQFTQSYAKTKEDADRLERCIKLMDAGFNTISFKDLPYREQAVFLRQNFDSIVYDGKCSGLEIRCLSSNSLK
ncbi:MAG: recombinase family protein [Erysipelotrichaceae bacterium]|nr:recombinase family protein [Erysipelotrichaceae bacterium]